MIYKSWKIATFGACCFIPISWRNEEVWPDISAGLCDMPCDAVLLSLPRGCLGTSIISNLSRIIGNISRISLPTVLCFVLYITMVFTGNNSWPLKKG